MLSFFILKTSGVVVLPQAAACVDPRDQVARHQTAS
jgi:hypothetical protein